MSIAIDDDDGKVEVSLEQADYAHADLEVGSLLAYLLLGVSQKLCSVHETLANALQIVADMDCSDKNDNEIALEEAASDLLARLRLLRKGNDTP